MSEPMPTPSMVVIRQGLGLLGALALLAACGSDKSSTENHGVVDDSSGGSSGSSDMGALELECTVENYIDHPEIEARIDVGCLWVGDVPDCPVCDGDCAQGFLPCSCEPKVLCTEHVGEYCCYLVTVPDLSGTFVPGRPLRNRGVPVLPELARDGSRTSVPGDAYRELARHERASVDAFLTCAVELERLGAPAILVEANLVAATQEADHARLALRAAEAIDGCVSTLTMPRAHADADLRAFVRGLIEDGCLGEAAAAREAEWALAQPEVREQQALRQFWQQVARDEASHAALAWSTLEFLLVAHRELESVVHVELQRVMQCAAGRAEPEFSDDQREQLEQIGIASLRTKAHIRAQIITDLIAAAEARALASAA